MIGRVRIKEPYKLYDISQKYSQKLKFSKEAEDIFKTISFWLFKIFLHSIGFYSTILYAYKNDSKLWCVKTVSDYYQLYDLQLFR